MDSDEGNKQKENRYFLSSDSDFSKPIWLRYPSIQVESINKRLLDYNAYYVCICAPILWIISIFI